MTPGMMVEGEVWWDNAEPVQSFRQICAAGTPPNCLGGSTSVLRLVDSDSSVRLRYSRR